MLKYLSSPFKWFFKLEAASGLVLLLAAIIALLISNSTLSDLYFSTLNKCLFLGINEFGIKLSVLLVFICFINRILYVYSISRLY